MTSLCVPPRSFSQDAASRDDEPIPVARHLEQVRLGDSLRRVRRAYPPLREWVGKRDPSDDLMRYSLDRACVKGFPDELESLRLGLRDGRVVEIQAIYGGERARTEPLEKLVVHYEMIYGEPTRHDLAYSWRDPRTVLRAANAEVRSPDGKKLEMRPSVEVYDVSAARHQPEPAETETAEPAPKKTIPDAEIDENQDLRGVRPGGAL